MSSQNDVMQQRNRRRGRLIATATLLSAVLAVVILQVSGKEQQQRKPRILDESSGEQCYSYGPDRHVYPQGSPTSDHQLQYTKALSKEAAKQPTTLKSYKCVSYILQYLDRPQHSKELPLWTELSRRFRSRIIAANMWFSFSIRSICKSTLDLKTTWTTSVFIRLLRVHSTFVCPTEILAFSDRIAEFKKINTEVVACSVDSHFTHLAWINTPRKEGGLGPLKIPLLSDLTHKISKDYGVYLEDLGHTLRWDTVWFDRWWYVTDTIFVPHTFRLRSGLFIIDQRGVLRQITMNDLPVGRSVDETLRLVQAFQYTDSHGEVCPAGWKPGADTVSESGLCV